MNFLRNTFLALLLFGTIAARAVNPPPVCDRVRYQALPGNEAAMAGGIISGSNISRTDGFEKIGEVKEAPSSKDWQEIKLENKKVYRWLRFSGPRAAAGKIGKVEFYAGEQLIAGAAKGVASTPFVRVKTAGPDSKPVDAATTVNPEIPDDRAVVYDLFDSAAAQRPSFSPASAEFETEVEVKLGSTPGAVIRYTLDGSWPTATHGEVYAAPLHLDKTTTISAVALLADRAPSLLATTTYLRKDTTKPGLNTAHIGNSLTGTTGGFSRFMRTAGYDQKSLSFLRPGALTRELWAVSTGDYAADKLAASKEEAAQKRGSMTWADYWAKIGTVDLITLQPRDFDLDKELEAEANFIKLFRQKSPDLQPWLYCEWVELARLRPSDKGTVPSYQMKKTFPALTWEESMSAMLLYVEELQHRLNATLPEGQRVKVLPSALAMGWMRHMIDHGQVPGVAPGSFYSLLFNDQVHPADAPVHGTANGAYLVDMTWFAAFYRKSPEGKVLPIETTYTKEQAHLVERLAWDVIKNYPDCGLYEKGTVPCGQPEISSDAQRITLKSATPGAWFRYTLDGTTPTRTTGYVYCGVISVQPGIHVKAVAYKSGMADSPVVEMKP